MLQSNLYDYSDAYMLVKSTITIIGEEADRAAGQVNKRKK